MRAVDGRDRVELDRPQPPERRFDVGGAGPAKPRRIALVRDDVAPQLGERDRLHWPSQRAEGIGYASIGT